LHFICLGFKAGWDLMRLIGYVGPDSLSPRYHRSKCDFPSTIKMIGKIIIALQTANNKPIMQIRRQMAVESRLKTMRKADLRILMMTWILLATG
jgi:hypothetical protein